MTALWAGPGQGWGLALFFPARNDCAELRRRLDDMQLAGLDLVTIERWRKLLDAYESGQELRARVEDATSDLESAIDGFALDPSEHRIDIGGTLDDLVGEGLKPEHRAVIEQAIAAKAKASEDAISGLLTSSIDSLHSVVKKLDEAIGKDADESGPDRAARRRKPKQRWRKRSPSAASAPRKSP